MTVAPEFKRLLCIGSVVGCMVLGVLVVGTYLTQPEHDRHRTATPGHQVWSTEPLPHDPRANAATADVARSGTFADRARTLPMDMVAAPGVVLRDMPTYYGRRAYIGAPPHIPHEVTPENSLQQSCNVCHEKGGFVPKWNAYAPVTPHPQYTNCTQCHVENRTESLFRATTFTSPPPPALHRPALPGNPPPIPHSVQLRQDCLSCHAGPHVPLEIRTSHPERQNCRQCHTTHETDAPFVRGISLTPVTPDVGVERLLLTIAALQEIEAQRLRQQPASQSIPPPQPEHAP